MDFLLFLSLKKKKKAKSTVYCQAVRLQGIQCSEHCGDCWAAGDKLVVWARGQAHPAQVCSVYVNDL